MRIVFLLLIFFIQITAYAQKSRQYVFRQSTKASPLDIDETNAILNAYGFSELDHSKKGQIVKGGYDQLYFDLADPKKMAILKFDLYLNTQESLIRLNLTDFVCHGQNSRGRDFALFVSGEKEATFNKICHQLRNPYKQSHSKYFLKIDFLLQNVISKAFAGDFENSKCTHQSQNYGNGLSELTQNLNETKIFQQLGTCVSSALRGGTDFFKGSYDSVTHLFNSSPEQLWNELKQQVVEIKNFVLNLKSEVVKMVNGLKNLNSDLIVKLGCEMAGSFLAEKGLTAIVGLGAFTLVTLLKQATQRIGSMESLFSRLNQLQKLGKSHLAEEVLSCAIK